MEAQPNEPDEQPKVITKPNMISTTTSKDDGNETWTKVSKSWRDKGKNVMVENSTIRVPFQNRFKPLRILNHIVVTLDKLP